jgi:DNA-binding HxlR family transcriptional regulator
MARTNRYDHFCPVARSLEVIGEKWSLLIVRDLLAGPRRFSDLQRGMANITPKWLSLRLRELEAAGLVEREQEPGRREVWYRLTPRGEDLRPVIGALNVWGMRHAIRPAVPGERLDPARMVISFAGYLNTTGVEAPPGTGWRFVFDGTPPQDLVFDRGRWRRMPAPAPALVVSTTREGWAAMLSQDPQRPAPAEVLELSGSDEEIERFQAVLGGILRPPGPPRPASALAPVTRQPTDF